MDGIRKFDRIEAMAYLGCGRTKFYQLISKGFLARGVQIGTKKVWFEDNLAHAIALLKKEANKGVKK